MCPTCTHLRRFSTELAVVIPKGSGLPLFPAPLSWCHHVVSLALARRFHDDLPNREVWMFHQNTAFWPHWILRRTIHDDYTILLNEPFYDFLDKCLLLDHLRFRLNFIFNLLQIPSTQVLLLNFHSFGFLVC